jgi:hypothetical protein
LVEEVMKENEVKTRAVFDSIYQLALFAKLLEPV